MPEDPESRKWQEQESQMIDPWRRRIVEVLQERGAWKPCHRCGSESLGLTKSYFNISATKSPASFYDGMAVPSILVICANCGAMTFHSLAVLGLLKDAEPVDFPEIEKRPGGEG